MDNQQQRPRIGMEVIDNADRLIGTVETVEQDHFVVQKGFFFPKNHRIPNSAIGNVTEKEITLSIGRDLALSSSLDRDWADHPEAGDIVPQKGDVEKSAAKGGIDPHKF